MRWAVALLALATVAGCGTDGGVRVEGTAPASPKHPVYAVVYMGDALQRPAAFALSEFSSASKVRWTSWGGETATGTGEVSGMWCIPGCESKGYPATITLSKIHWLERSGYYSRISVSSTHKLGEDLTDQPLEVPPR
ncbi:hypothetical protein ACIBG8_27010 [Nonomuraea sp. NPDC050556]|uniref:hypothetical protein n=1 Tax=Nonomuraea sp. NPDC050556 TaxID=3364369 RepID=UPI0037B0FDB6